MINPYTFYIVGFGISLAVYPLGWSEAYPKLSESLVAFLLTTMVAHFLLSTLWYRKEVNKTTQKVVAGPQLNPWLITGFLYACWTADFIYEGGIPLYKMVMNLPFNYKKFGFPSLHVFTVTLSSFYCIYLLQFFLITKKKTLLFLYIVNMAAAILICTRGMLCINLASSLFLYALHLKEFSYKRVLVSIPLMIIILYLFGVAGTIRVSFESKTKYDRDSFLENGRATTQFRESFIPKEFFWPYIYISSPIANLQVNINTYLVKPITIQRVLLYVNNEWLFESLSKRINAILGIEREKENIIKDPFIASTVYCRSYSYMGWSGIILMAMLLLMFPFVYNKWIPNNSFQTISVALLCTTYLLLAFDNTIRFMGLGFQLVYPVVFPWAENKLSKIKFLR